MNFSDYYVRLSAADKRDLATKLGTSVPYLSQIAHGHRMAGAPLLAQIESATVGAVTARELRPDLFQEHAA